MSDSSVVVAILAGGASRRMDGLDKAHVDLGGRRMVDVVVERLRPQAALLLISGASDLDTGLTFVPDEPDTFRGPAGGVLAVRRWLGRNQPDVEGFVTAPVDGPFVPDDLVTRLSGKDRSAIGSDLLGEHPTFAYWRIIDLDLALPQVPAGAGLPLRGLAVLCNARLEVFNDTRSLFNVNDADDLRMARKVLGG